MTSPPLPAFTVRALEHALQSLRLRGSVYCLFEGGDAWGLRLARAPDARFHAVRGGECWLRVEDDAPIRVEAGEMILLPHGERHDVLAAPDSAPVDALAALAGVEDPGRRVVRMGAGAVAASLICGGFQFADVELHPLLACLPRVIRLRANDTASAVLRGLLDIADAELRAPDLASEAVLGRLSEILFIATIRVYARHAAPTEAGWLGALADPAVGAALAAIHAAAADADLSVTAVAREAGISKTTLTARFRELLGTSPGAYLTRWRMLQAKLLLERGDLTVADVAARVGYASEAAFSRAFQREVGTSPSHVRAGSEPR